jgi:putative transposase
MQEVIQIRQSQKRIGGRKLFFMLQEFLQLHNIAIGRDSFFDLLRRQGLLIRKSRRHIPVTTWSNHWFRKYPNRIKDFTPLRAGRLWVSDITYVHVSNGFAYLSLVTDAYSRKIVGYCLYKNLSADGCVAALKMALKNNPQRERLIHHSDRGVQYCCSDYVSVLEKASVRISMTQNGDPLENAIAERVNGILKSELLQSSYSSFKEAVEGVNHAITVYNHERPHTSINMLTPAQAHHLEGGIKRLWKNYYHQRKEGPAVKA